MNFAFLGTPYRIPAHGKEEVKIDPVPDLQTKQNIYWWGKACTALVSFSRFRLKCMSFFCKKYIFTWSCTAQVWSRLRLLVLGALRKRVKLCLPHSNFHLSRHQECKWNHSLGQRKHPSFSTIKRGWGVRRLMEKKHLKFPFWIPPLATGRLYSHLK